MVLRNSLRAQIEQVLCEPNTEHHPTARAVTYRGYLSTEFQMELAEKLSEVWHTVISGHIYKDVSREESDKKIAHLERYNIMVLSGNPINKIIRTAKGK